MIVLNFPTAALFLSPSIGICEKFHRLQTMACAGPLCTDTINEYKPASDGSSAVKAAVKGGSVHFAGCYAFKRTKHGLFRPGEFDT